MRSMHPNDAIAQKLKNMTGIQDEPILIPEEKYPFPADIAIYDQTIGYMSPENGGLAILIESKEISEVMKSVFDMAWQEAKRLSIESRKKAQKNRQRQRQRGKND